MRSTTQWSAGCLGIWFFLNIATCAVAPNSLDDPNFASKVSTGSGLQGLGSLFLIASIVLILITAYNNLFSKESIEVRGDWNQASYGSTIVSRSTGPVSVSATYDTSFNNYAILSKQDLASLGELKALLEQSSSSDGSKAVKIINDAEKEMQKGASANYELILGSISRAITIAERILPSTQSIIDLISSLKKII